MKAGRILSKGSRLALVGMTCLGIMACNDSDNNDEEKNGIYNIVWQAEADDEGDVFFYTFTETALVFSAYVEAGNCYAQSPGLPLRFLEGQQYLIESGRLEDAAELALLNAQMGINVPAPVAADDYPIVVEMLFDIERIDEVLSFRSRDTVVIEGVEYAGRTGMATMTMTASETVIDPVCDFEDRS